MFAQWIQNHIAQLLTWLYIGRSLPLSPNIPSHSNCRPAVYEYNKLYICSIAHSISSTFILWLHFKSCTHYQQQSACTQTLSLAHYTIRNCLHAVVGPLLCCSTNCLRRHWSWPHSEVCCVHCQTDLLACIAPPCYINCRKLRTDTLWPDSMV